MATNQNNNGTLAAVAEAVAQATPTKNLLEKLSTEQKAALESKLNALSIETRSSIAATYPGFSTVELYIIRQMVKEANGKLASNQRPVWYNILSLNAASLKSGVKEIREYAETQLRQLAESIDSKESTTLLKKYKQQKDTTSSDPHIVQLCGIFGIQAATLK